MKSKNIVYWTASILAAIVLGASGILAATHATPMMTGLHHLGYPSYFVNILAVGKIVGLVILLDPNMPRLKEWAYSGFTITILSACYSHFSSGDGWLAAEPLVTFLFLMVSYAYRPVDRRLTGDDISNSRLAFASSR